MKINRKRIIIRWTCPFCHALRAKSSWQLRRVTDIACICPNCEQMVTPDQGTIVKPTKQNPQRKDYASRIEYAAACYKAGVLPEARECFRQREGEQ